ncbi:MULTISPECIES: hypothetical protein [Methylobacter]
MTHHTLVKVAALLLLFAFEAAAQPDSKFDIMANLDTGLGNVTVTDNGRIIMSMHQSSTLNGGVSASKPPYYLLQIKALAAAGLSGR